MFWQSARFEAKSCFWLKTEEAYDQQKKLMASKKTINMDRGSGVSQLYLQLYSWKCWKSEIFVLFFRESFQNNLSLHSYLIRCRLGLVGRQSSCFLTKQKRCLSWQHSQQTALNHKRTRGKLQKRLWCCFCLAQPVPSLPCGRFKQSLKMLPGKTSILFKKQLLSADLAHSTGERWLNVKGSSFSSEGVMCQGRGIKVRDALKNRLQYTNSM